MTLLETMRHRRSVRRYTGERIEGEKLQQILTVAYQPHRDMPFGLGTRPIVKNLVLVGENHVRRSKILFY